MIRIIFFQKTKTKDSKTEKEKSKKDVKETPPKKTVATPPKKAAESPMQKIEDVQALDETQSITAETNDTTQKATNQTDTLATTNRTETQRSKPDKKSPKVDITQQSDAN